MVDTVACNECQYEIEHEQPDAPIGASLVKAPVPGNKCETGRSSPPTAGPAYRLEEAED